MANSTRISLRDYTALLASLTVLAGLPASAQVPAGNDGYGITSLGDTGRTYSSEPYDDSLGGDIEPLDFATLETLVGPIALYPDDLLAIVLPASTYPLQIVQAARFLDAYESDNSLEPDESWDESVVALINYPDVIRLLNDDIDWTWQLGEAVISQQEDVVAAVESFRDRAYAAGNLKSDEHQNITRDEGIIEIVPIEDDVIYVPYYEPERVVVRQARPVYYYYERPCPVYYYPYPAGYAFSSNYFWGVTSAYRIGWGNNLLHVQHPSYWGHPYYGHHYYGHHYRRSSITIHNSIYFNNARRHSANRYRDGDYWQPRRHSGSRPSDYYAHTRHYRADTSTTRQGRRHSNHAEGNRISSSHVAPNQRQHRATTAHVPTQRPRLRAERESRNSSDTRRSSHDARPRPQHTARNNVSREQRQTQTQHQSRVSTNHRNRQNPVQREARHHAEREHRQDRGQQHAEQRNHGRDRGHQQDRRESTGQHQSTSKQHRTQRESSSGKKHESGQSERKSKRHERRTR